MQLAFYCYVEGPVRKKRHRIESTSSTDSETTEKENMVINHCGLIVTFIIDTNMFFFKNNSLDNNGDISDEDEIDSPTKLKCMVKVLKAKNQMDVNHLKVQYMTSEKQLMIGKNED